MPYDCIILLEPANKSIVTHIIDGDNWQAVSALWVDLKCISNEHECDQFTSEEAQTISSTVDLFLTDMCYTKNGKTYRCNSDNKIYSAKAARAIIPFLKQCKGFTVGCVEISMHLNIDLD